MTTPTPVPSGKPTPAAFCTTHGFPDLTRWVTLEDEVTSRSVRNALHDKLIGYGEYVEHLIYPEGLTDGWESSVFSEAEHEHLATFHRHIALLDKECALLDVEGSMDDELVMIKRLVVEWPKLVSEMKRIITKSRDAYGKQAIHGPASYLG